MDSNRKLLTCAESAKMLGISRAFFYVRLVQTGEIASIKLGRARRIPATELDNYITRKLEAQRGGEKLTHPTPQSQKESAA